MTPDLNTLRHRYTQTLAILLILLGAVGLVPVLFGGNVNERALIILVVFIAVNGAWLFLTNIKRWDIAAYGLLATLVLGALLLPVDFYLIAGLLAMVTAAVLSNRYVYVTVNVLVLGKISVDTILLIQAYPGMLPPNIYAYIVPLVMLAFVSLVMRYFMNGADQAAAASSKSAVLLKATSDVGEILAQIIDMDELLERSVNQIRTRFGHYHVQIFMVNETRDQAILVASTGEIGKRLLARGHQLSVGSQSVIGQVVLRSATVQVSDTERDAVFFRNELLQNTRAEVALPIIDGGQTIGVLDIQSGIPNIFSPTDVQALEIIADLLTSAIRNARVFRLQAETVKENQRLSRDSEGNLREIQRLNQQLTRTAWQTYQTDAHAVTGVTLENDQVSSGGGWSDSLTRAGKEGRVVEGEDNYKTVAVPVMLRGEVIGAIEVEAGTETNPETVEMVQAVAQRLALSLENARLYEATLEAAAQEQRINDIAARFQSVATVDELLRITLAELSETLGAEHSSIRLGSFAEEQAP